MQYRSYHSIINNTIAFALWAGKIVFFFNMPIPWDSFLQSFSTWEVNESSELISRPASSLARGTSLSSVPLIVKVISSLIFEGRHLPVMNKPAKHLKQNFETVPEFINVWFQKISAYPHHGGKLTKNPPPSRIFHFFRKTVTPFPLRIFHKYD